MKVAIDTSVLVRILTNKPQPLAAEVISIIDKRISNGDTMVVSNLVLSEAYYAVQHHYGVDKKSALLALRFLSVQSGFEFSALAQHVLCADGLDHMNPGFVDRLICGEQEELGITVLSCEKSFARMPNAEVIP